MTRRLRGKLDYDGLLELARIRRVRVIETTGLEKSSGVSFNKWNREWIAIDSSLPTREKTRALGFLLENYPGKVRTHQRSPGEVRLGPGETHFQSLKCAKD